MRQISIPCNALLAHKQMPGPKWSTSFADKEGEWCVSSDF